MKQSQAWRSFLLVFPKGIKHIDQRTILRTEKDQEYTQLSGKEMYFSLIDQ